MDLTWCEIIKIILLVGIFLFVFIKSVWILVDHIRNYRD